MSSSSSSSSPSVITEIGMTGYLRSILTTDREVERLVGGGDGEKIVTLARGGSEAGAMASLNALSAGGVPATPGCGRPTNLQAISQVGGSQPGKPQVKLPEFTADGEKSVNWARRGGWLIVKIRAKYLTRGDVGQRGWVCLPGAPLESGQFIPHPKPISGKMPTAD